MTNRKLSCDQSLTVADGCAAVAFLRRQDGLVHADPEDWQVRLPAAAVARVMSFRTAAGACGAVRAAGPGAAAGHHVCAGRGRGDVRPLCGAGARRPADVGSCADTQRRDTTKARRKRKSQFPACHVVQAGRLGLERRGGRWVPAAELR